MKKAENYAQQCKIRQIDQVGPVNVWLVNGLLVRNHLFLDFTEGGNDCAYKWMPKNEIWLDDANAEEVPFIYLHELYERNIMHATGIGYEEAHDKANIIENQARNSKDPNKVNELLAREKERLKGMYPQTYKSLRKDSPTASTAHVSTALGNEAEHKKPPHGRFRKPQTFRDLTDSLKSREEEVGKRYSSVDELPPAVKNKIHDAKKRRQWMHVWNSAYDRHGDESRAFAEAWSVVGKSGEANLNFEVCKLDNEQRQVFGWASTTTIGGFHVVDKQGDIIPTQELEKAAYDFVLNSRQQGHNHVDVGVGRLIESMMFTKEKQQALGIDLGREGWFVGFYVDNEDCWQSIKKGDLLEFSIGGSAHKEEI